MAKSKTVAQHEQEWEKAAETPKRKRGRPAGSTKKPTSTTPELEPHISLAGKATVKYLNNADMLKAVIASKAQAINAPGNPANVGKTPKMNDTLARMLMLLVKRYGSKSNFASYTYNDDMQAFALMMLTRTWSSFNEEKSSNPFAYYTQCIKNSFIQYLATEKKNQRLRDELMIEEGLLPSYSYQLDYATKHHLSGSNSDEYHTDRSASPDDVHDRGASSRNTAVISSQFDRQDVEDESADEELTADLINDIHEAFLPTSMGEDVVQIDLQDDD